MHAPALRFVHQPTRLFGSAHLNVAACIRRKHQFLEWNDNTRASLMTIGHARWSVLRDTPHHSVPREVSAPSHIIPP